MTGPGRPDVGVAHRVRSVPAFRKMRVQAATRTFTDVGGSRGAEGKPSRSRPAAVPRDPLAALSDERHGDPRKVTDSWQRSPLHAAGSGRCLHFGKCACKRQLVPSRTSAPARNPSLRVTHRSKTFSSNTSPQNSDKGQFVVIENIDLPPDIEQLAQLETFTGDPLSGRQGLLYAPRATGTRGGNALSASLLKNEFRSHLIKPLSLHTIWQLFAGVRNLRTYRITRSTITS
jgi:hypothetical protein